MQKFISDDSGLKAEYLLTILCHNGQDTRVRDQQSGVTAVNQHNELKARALLFELIQQALTSSRKVTQITIRIPMHGDRLGTPKGSLEVE